jgi:6-pyruvoyltetrahydropterin/6-carboxytetrahydropterin synthase
MIQLTKIFQYEMAHAIHGYKGLCKNIHGHSYELHVTVALKTDPKTYLPPPGFAIDLKELYRLINTTVIEQLDHKLMLSRSFLSDHPTFPSLENLIIMEFEPSVENQLVYIQNTICKTLPENLKLLRLKLFETKNSYAEWVDCSI